MTARILASIVAALALLGSLPLWWWLEQERHRSAAPQTQEASTESTPLVPPAAEPTAPAQTPDVPPPPAEVAPEPVASVDQPVRPEQPQPELITGPDPGRSPLADRLNDPAGTITEDLAILQRVLNNFLLELGSHPVGSNREITAQLTGRNASRHAPLPPDLPAISAEGELIDRWGTPFFFHALSAREMEIRSAGPDLELYTADDVTWSPVPKGEN